MTPKGAAVLPRPFCCPFFCFPSHPSSRSPCPATYCQLFADFRRRRRQLFVNFYPRPPRAKFTFCQLLPAPRFGKVGILSTFGDTLRTLCQPPVNFLPTFARARSGKVYILSTFGDTLRTCGAPFVTFCHHFCRISVLLQTLTLHPRVYESGGGNAKNSPFPLPNIKKAGQTPRRVRADERGLFCFVCAPISALF